MENEMALQEARVLGYRCIFSGDKVDEKLLSLAAACYEIDWENWDSLLHIAKLEKVDGIFILNILLLLSQTSWIRSAHRCVSLL